MHSDVKQNSLRVQFVCTPLDIAVHSCDVPRPMSDPVDDTETDADNDSAKEQRVVAQLDARDLELLERLRTSLREDTRLSRAEAVRILIREKGRELFGDDAAA